MSIRTNLTAPDPAGIRLGPIWLSPGVTTGNAGTLLFGAFSTICLVTFISFIQPYLFGVIGIPREEQGGLAGLLMGLQESTQLVIAGLIGALSDRTGRRVVYVAGLIAMSLCLVIYPLAGSAAELIGYRILLAVGMTAATVMMSTCIAEYCQDETRGRWMGLIAVCNGLGVVLMATVLVKLPLWFGRLGYDNEAAIRYSFWTFGAYALALALVLRVGLRGHTTVAGRPAVTLLQQTTLGLEAARANPRIALAYLLAFASRGDLVILTIFISLWVIQAGLDAGLTPGAATAKAGMIFGLAQGIALLWSAVMGVILDRIRRLTGMCLAFGLAGLGYSALSMVADPFGPWMLPASILVGIGEGSAIVAAGVLIGQEAPAAIRGTVLGTFGLAGSLGIICLTFTGGQVFDHIGSQAPFAMMGLVNFAAFAVALWVRQRDAATARVIGAVAGTVRPID